MDTQMGEFSVNGNYFSFNLPRTNWTSSKTKSNNNINRYIVIH